MQQEQLDVETARERREKIALAKLAVHKVQDRWETDTFWVLLGSSSCGIVLQIDHSGPIFGITLRLPA